MRLSASSVCYSSLPIEQACKRIAAFTFYSHDFEEYVELLGQAGGDVGVRGSTAPCKPEELIPRMKSFIDSLQPLIALAEKNKAYLAIENYRTALPDSIDSFKAFADINTSKHLGMDLTPYHLQIVKASAPKVIRIRGKQLFFIYAWQHAYRMDQLPGAGPADCPRWIKALADIKYRHFVNPFVHVETKPDNISEALEKSRAYLLDCYAKALEPESVIRI